MDNVKCLIFRAPNSNCFQNRTPKGASGLLDNTLKETQKLYWKNSYL